MTITMPRGDIRPVNFFIYDANDALVDIAFDEIYFSVKKSYLDKTPLFQKRLSDGGISSLGNGEYRFLIEAADTDNLRIGKYVFDIEVVKGTEIKQTSVGDLNLTNEVTFVTNEG